MGSCISDSAKKTTVSPGIARLGSAVAAGFAQFTFIRKSALTPGDTVIVADRIAPFEPLTPGEYKLHLFLFSRCATELKQTGAGAYAGLLSGSVNIRLLPRARSSREVRFRRGAGSFKPSADVDLRVGFSAEVACSFRIGGLGVPLKDSEVGVSALNHKPVNRMAGFRSTDLTSEFLERGHKFLMAKINKDNVLLFARRGPPKGKFIVTRAACVTSATPTISKLKRGNQPVSKMTSQEYLCWHLSVFKTQFWLYSRSMRFEPAMQTYLKDRMVLTGMAILVLGSGPLIAIILFAKVGLLRDPNPNPIGPGLLFIVSFWPGVFVLLVGLIKVWWRTR